MKDYNDVLRLRTKLLILKDELSKTTEGIKDIYEKFSNLDYIEEIEEINGMIRELDFDAEEHDHFEAADKEEEIARLMMEKDRYVEALEFMEKLDKDYNEISDIASKFKNIRTAKEVYLNKFNEDALNCVY